MVKTYKVVTYMRFDNEFYSYKRPRFLEARRILFMNVFSLFRTFPFLSSVTETTSVAMEKQEGDQRDEELARSEWLRPANRQQQQLQ